MVAMTTTAGRSGRVIRRRSVNSTALMSNVGHFGLGTPSRSVCRGSTEWVGKRSCRAMGAPKSPLGETHELKEETWILCCSLG
jgi:hypothetical protein